ncbi:hypothetical protein FXF51_01230 [Nonomuraea sp. PA05]|uniref:FAD-dependent oxidoreductase n=1 Tax=Nonomuraea sp. PA05 TaxID=2604466 RepID=UPI0011DA2F11|nr:hypothetical protein [Nonomuraea sp. PA05]TYB71089.1 hypothetical protein FXF51_01230 [Nonomuraea sp. PA05]
MLALAPGKGIAAHREPGGVLHTYVQLNKPREWADGIGLTDAGTARALVAEEFEGWAPELTALITDGETAPVVRLLHALPDGHRWQHVPGVTLLGDAAHLTVPSGDGANLAMYDGAELGKAAADASQLLPRYLGDGAPRSVVDMFTGAGADDVRTRR